MNKIIEKLFIKLGMDDEGAKIFSILSCFLLSVAFVAGIVIGGVDANNDKKCRATSISGLFSAAPYAIGCNIFKERFDIRLN